MRFLILVLIFLNFCVGQNNVKQITLGGGCFWCVEAAFQDAKGVQSVTSGFSGGKYKNPTYSDVVSGKTQHAEVCQIIYNPQEVSLSNLLDIFFLTHDPTTLNRQGNDIGYHYRSIIFYSDDSELEIINNAIDYFNKQYYNDNIVTEVTSFNTFYEAEEYHQEYFNKNSQEPYCKFVIEPKLKQARLKLRKYY